MSDKLPSSVEHPAAPSAERTATTPIERRRHTPEIVVRDREGREIVENIRERLEPRAIVKPPPDARALAKQSEEYREQYLPDYLKGKEGKPGPFSRVLGWVLTLKEKLGRTKVSGRENIPESGPFVVVCNHSGGETGTILGLFDKHPLRIAAAEELNWKRSSWRPWLLKKLGMLKVRESLSYLNKKEKEDLLTRIPGKARYDGYRAIVEREEKGEVAVNREFVHTTVAALIQGDCVAVFPEGLFLYQGGRVLRRGYGGIELIAREYKRVTGKDLPLVPVGISGKSVGVGAPVIAGQNPPNVSLTDHIMAQVAKQLPEQERGYYADLAART